jgi:hypothetical protein
MTPGTDSPPRRGWHRALTAAITGTPGDGPDQERPDVVALAAELRATVGTANLVEHVREVRAAGRAWPHPVPAELMAGLGHAQFAAALASLQRELALDRQGVVRAGDRPEPMTANLRRLLDEVPPHHGT